MEAEDGKGTVQELNEIELTDEEVRYLFSVVMPVYKSSAENVSIAKKLVEIMKGWLTR